MSFTDPTADAVQPEQGQGDGGATDAPYAEYLNRIPEQVRGDVEPIFKEWDANTTKRFQDAAEFRKQWEPLAETGVDQLSKDEVAWLVQFRGALDDPQTMQQWWDGYAQENGLNQPEAPQEPAPLDDFGGFQDPQQLQTLIDQATGPLKQQLEQMQGHIEQQQQQQQQAQLVSQLEGQVAQLEKKQGRPFSDEERDVLARFASRYNDAETAIPRAYEDMQKFVGGVEKGAFQQKVDAPAAAEAGGVADVNVPQFKSVHDDGVKNAAMEFLRNNNRA